MSQPLYPQIRTLSREEAISALWNKGVISWKLDKNQKEMHALIKDSDHGMIVIGASRQIGKCIIEGTEVLTVNRGIVEIQNLIKSDFVYGYNADGSISPTQIVDIIDSGYKEVIDLVNHNRILATCSEDHVWLTHRQGSKGYSERKTKDFYNGIGIARKFIDPLGGSINEPHAYAIGALLGDGCSKQQYNSIHLSSEDKQVPTKVSQVLNTQLKHSGSSNHTWYIGDFKGFRKPVNPTYCAYYNEWCKNRYAHEKIVDLDVIKTWNRQSMLEFLAGLLDTDGRIARHGNELTVGFYSQSKSLIDAVNYLFHYLFQYKCNIHIDNRDKYVNGPLYYISITNNLINKRIIRTLTPHLAKDKKKWRDEYNECTENNTNPDYVGVKKENKRYAKCYDISINNDTHLYLLANGLVTHNSWAMTAIAVETCIQKPFQTVKFIAPKVKDIRRIIAPLIREICADAPKNLKPTFKSNESVFRFPNGSEIQLAGTDNGHAESIRGSKAHLCIVDEAGFCDDLEYVVNSILVPTTTTTGGKIVMISTPSKTHDHPFITFLREAEMENRYIKKTIYDNPRLTPQDIERIAATAGGINSVNFRREYMVEIITSEEDAIVPEFTKELQLSIIKEYPRPSHFDSYISMDIGGRDFTAVLFGYYDFLNAKLVIEDEFVMTYRQTSEVLAKNINEKEFELWQGRTPYLRVSDNNNIILLNDLSTKYGISFIPTAKDNFDAALNNMRTMVKSGKIIINPRCKRLISHLDGGIWNKARTTFAKSADKGHFDCIAALIYLCRNINLNKNPYPAGFAPGMHSVHYNAPKDDHKPSTPLEHALVKQFQIKKLGIRKKHR